MAAFLACAPAPGWAHHGRTLVLLHPAGNEAALAANLLAAYMGEQMGREVKACQASTPEACAEGVLAREAPMCLVPAADWRPAAGLERVGGALRIVGVEWVLVLGSDVASELAFSLVPRYVEKLDSAFRGRDLAREVSLVTGGAGARGLAEEILRKADLI